MKAVLVAQATFSSCLFSVGRLWKPMYKAMKKGRVPKMDRVSVTHLSTVELFQIGRPVYAEDEEAYG